MKRTRLSITAGIVTALLLLASGCFGNASLGGSQATPLEVIKPKPSVERITASTSGTEGAYYAILDIIVKNTGAEGTILVVGSVVQGGVTQQNEMPVYMMNGESHELKMTFPLKWKGGEFTAAAHCQLP
jgi:ABC-type glycerol-3-phosphate transport system substrate-binding protein